MFRLMHRILPGSLGRVTGDKSLALLGKNLDDPNSVVRYDAVRELARVDGDKHTKQI